MSTKIYYAYKVHESITPPKLFKILLNIKKKVVEHYKTLALNQGVIDLHKLQFSSTATPEQKNLFKEMFGSGLRTDVTKSCVVYFHKKGTYIQFFMGHDIRFRETYDNIKWFTDFHYQDQCDMPEDVTEKEWNHRRKIWKEIIDFDDTYGIPAKCGLSYTFYNFEDFDWQLYSNALNLKKQS